MTVSRQKRNTWLFIGFFILAGIVNVLSRSNILFFESLMTCVNYIILIGLILFWIQSVHIRLLPSKSRTYLVSAAWFMLIYILLRIFKYRLVGDAVIPARYTVYLYWTPLMLIPALFLMTCICIRRGEQNEGKWNEKLLLIPAILLSIMTLTNDLHKLVYIPKVNMAEFIVGSGTYSYGFGFYLLYVWMFLTMISGIILLFSVAGRKKPSAILSLIGVILLWVGLLLLHMLVIEKQLIFRMYNAPEIHTFGMLAVIEVCIRYRLIPYNENYAGFFGSLQTPVIITDLKLSPAIYSATEIAADNSKFRDALDNSVYIDRDHKLLGRRIRAGFVFWVEDESSVHQAQDKLKDANEVLEQENSLIQAETTQKEEEAYLQSRHRIYHEIAQEMYPCQKRIGEILDRISPDEEDFKEKIARVSVLNSYVKRKTNLLLLASERETLSTQELFLALDESSNYLRYAGLSATTRKPAEQEYPADQIIALYDAFEIIAEQLIGEASSLMITWNGEGLRLAAITSHLPDKERIILPVHYIKNEDTLYMDIIVGKDGEMA